jgi:hypothetical protein
MIVLFNVKISNQRLMPFQRHNLRTDKRLDVFKYCISSYAVMDPIVSKFIFYIKLDHDLIDERDNLEKYIIDEMGEEKVQIFWTRNENLANWRNTYPILESIDDNTIFFAGNDDHIFMDYNLDALRIGNDLVSKSENPHAALQYSHWFETIRIAKNLKAVLDESKMAAKFPWCFHDAIRIVRKELWHHYWFNLELEAFEREQNSYHPWALYRTDGITVATGHKLFVDTWVPTRELCRHYDGYSHVGNLSNCGPALEIPLGFFNKTMKIKYGYNEYDPTVTNVNPAIRKLKSAYGINGTDYRFTLDRIPLFCHKKLQETDIFPEIDMNQIKEGYNHYILESVTVPMQTYGHGFDNENTPPKEWFKNLYLG